MTSDQPDFSTRLHGLRSAELRRLPQGADTVLHGGAAGAWYFKWFDDNYPGEIKRHIGVEAFSERPLDLPQHVEWLRHTLGDMSPVQTGSVDIVFGGQVIEHLWANDVADFLVESHRVLRPGGLIVLDSPNRRITEAIDWYQPEHTAELAVDEITELLAKASFELEELRGVLLGYDRTRHVFLALDDGPLSWEERAELAADRPEDSFVWWLVARRTDAEPDSQGLHALTSRQADTFRARRLGRFLSPLPAQRATGRVPFVRSPHDFAGTLIHSVPSPFAAGIWQASFALRLQNTAVDRNRPIAFLDVTSDFGATRHARREVLAGDLDPQCAWTAIDLAFDFADMTMGVELEVHTYGHAPLDAQLAVAIRQPSDASISLEPASQTQPIHTPEPRTLEIVEMLGRRAASKAKAALARRTRAHSG